MPGARQASSRSSFRQPGSWLVVIGGLAGYVGLVFALTRYRVQLDAPLPWWAAQAAPPILYGLLIVLFLRRVTPGGFIGGTLTLWAAHVLLGTLTPLLAAIFDPLNRGRMLIVTFPPPPLPQVLWVALLLVPLRDILAPGSPRRADRPSGVELKRAVQPAPSSQRFVPVTHVVSAPAPVEPVAPAPTAREPAAPSESAHEPAQLAAEAAALEWEARMSQPEAPTPPALAPSAPAPRVPDDAVVRVPFARLAAQFSTDTFLLPLDRVASSLTEPGQVLVPQRLILPQLGEGLVSVPWEAVAEQFPREILAVTDEEVMRGLREGGLVLPLDEVVHQLPPELFVSAGPGPDVRGLESFPAPFQPLMSEPPVSHLVTSEPEPVAGAAEAPPVDEVPELRPALTAAEFVLEPPSVQPAAEPADGSGDDVRVSFDRVAAQLPADSFLLPLERVGANLSEPGRLRVPRALVLSQLGEGQVRVTWQAVAGQFPRQLLAVSEEEIAEQLGEGLILPLDEVIRQIPPDVFGTAMGVAELRGIEQFPAPFQPLLSQPEMPEMPEPEPAAEPAAEPLAEAAPEPVAASPAVEPIVADDEEAPALILGPESLEPPQFDLEPAIPLDRDAQSPSPSPEEELAPRLIEIPDVEPEPALMESLQAELRMAPPVPVEGEWAPRAAEAPRPEELGAARRIAALMGPLASLGVAARVVNGVTLFTLSSSGVPEGLPATVAGLMLPVLANARAAWPVDQLTLRGPRAALVLTPLGANARGPVLVAAVSQAGSLALLEILCRRAAAQEVAGGAAGEGAAWGNGRPAEPELLDAEPPARAHKVAATLGALGPVTASALRDPAGERSLYLFLPPGSDARAVGGFADELARAMRTAAASGAAFDTAVVRSGQRCLVIRPDEGADGRARLVVAAGETARPGLAYRQVERAVTALGSA
jgi:hypothetical protein